MAEHLTVIRLASHGDAADIARLYNEGIDERNATFETDLRTAEDIRGQLRERGDRYPTVVALREEQVVACAWASQYRTRACYSGIAEFSVYVTWEARGQGVGHLLMKALIQECEKRDLWKLVARIFPENTPSRALCGALGFREVGLYRRHGRIDGQWLDCVIVKLLLGEAARE